MRRPRPDTRPRWNDPDVPVIRQYRMADGSVKIDPPAEYEQRYRAFMVEQGAAQPSWRDDPTYNLRRKRHARDD